MSEIERQLEWQLQAAGLPEPEPEHRFHPPRRWRLDFAYVEEKIGIECEGGTWVSGRHVRPQGFQKDCEKYNQAALDGWCVLRFTAEMVKSGVALSKIEEALDAVSKDRKE